MTGIKEAMRSPTVSFVIPCYNLAHFLPECVNSILAQTYLDFEVLIMDDCSPDDTEAIVRAFQDPRITYVRNESNLGALRNYNEGIRLSRGKYVWLISADDYLKVPYVLQRYVDLMEANRRVGFTFCPAIAVIDGKETGLVHYSSYGDRDAVIAGRIFLRTLLYHNLVVAPAAMARREYYEKISYFLIDPVCDGLPIDMIWGGDWHLWCMFALHGDVGYFAEPMICYREHDLSSTSKVTKERIENCFRGEVIVPWKTKEKADDLGFRDVSRKCLNAVAFTYAQHLTTKQYRSSASTVTMTQFEQSLCGSTPNENERRYVRARVRAEMGDRFYQRRDFASAKNHYRAATDLQPWLIAARVKKLLLLLGRPGHFLRRLFRKLH
jgi:glycosyltransferase involved in cell wall biosynthesis